MRWPTHFLSRIDANHPDDIDLMYDSVGPLLDEESIALWEQYADEFVAEMTG